MQLAKLSQKQPTGKLFKSDDENYDKSFLRAIKPVIFISQLFGLFPISGLFSPDPLKIKFSWLSLRTLFSAVFVVCSLSYTLLHLHFQTSAGPLSPANIGGILFFLNCFFISLFLFHFAMKFSLIIDRWRQVEKILQKSNFREVAMQSGWSLRRRISFCAGIFMVAAAVEHSFSISTTYLRGVYEREACNWTVGNAFDDFITKQLFFTFNAISYNRFNALIAEYLNVAFTFYWSFLDIFLMVISIGLSYNYEKINNRLKFLRERVVKDEVWYEIRKDYNEVSELLKFVDKHLDKMIVLACFNDSYFILVQLLNVSMRRFFVMDRVYYYYSILFLICRTTGLFLLASRIYENSRQPLRITRMIPNDGWTQEIERFNDQIYSEINALSGMNFFYLTRNVLFGLAGTILTYELVLLQYNTSEEELEAWVDCRN